MIKCLIVDDEFACRNSLNRMLETYCPQVKVVAKAEDVESGISAFHKYQPDLIFLDIKMPNGTGFDFVSNTNSRKSKIVFVSAYKKYAINAFRHGAVDYLLKPVEAKLLVNVISKTENELARDQYLSNPSTVGQPIKITLHTIDQIFLINTHEVIRCESDGGYTRFFMETGDVLMVTKVLGHYEKQLEAHGFQRVHRSHLINIQHIDNIDKREGMSVMMKDGFAVPVSSRQKRSLLTRIEQL